MKDLYLISSKTLQYPATFNRSEDGLPPINRGCIIKIGESIDPFIRVKELDGTFVHEVPIVLEIWNNSHLSDKQVHKELEKRGYPKHREDKDREFFEFETKEQAKRVLNDILFGTKNLKTFQMRKEQKDIVDGVCNLFNVDMSRLEKRKFTRALINAKIRFGKCHTSYKIAKNMGFKKVLILTYKPNGVSESWQDDIDHVEFGDFIFKKAIEMDDVRFEKTDKVQIIFASFQDALGENGNKKKWDSIFGQEIDLLIIDECHYGYETDKSKIFLSKLKYKYEMSLSGTPFKAILDGKYEREEVFTWTYLQEQILRKKEKESDWKTNIYRGLPEFEVYLCKHNPSLVSEFLKYFKKEEKVTNLKLFSNEKLIYDFLSWVKMDKNMSKNITNHMFWYFEETINTNSVEKVLKAHPYWKDYVVINASGDKEKDIEKTKIHIFDEKDKTITLSCGRWNTGSTVKQWSSVWMLDDGSSAENWFQTTGRCGTPWVVDGGNFIKEEVKIVDFNSDRALRCFVKYSSVVCKYEKKDPLEYVRELLDCMPIYSVDGSSLSKVSIETLMVKFNDIMSDSFGSLSLIDTSKVDNNIIDILSDIKGTSQKSVKHSLNEDSVGRGKNSVSAIVSKGGEIEILEKVEIKDFVNQARIVTERIKNLLFALDNDDIKSVDDLSPYSERFKIHTGIEYDKFIILLNSGFISREKINESLELFNINNKYLCG